MSGVPARVAVQTGAATVRVAAVAVDGDPWLVAELPAPDPAPPVADLLAVVLAELIGPALDELVIVHPACWLPSRVAALVRATTGLAGRLGTVAAPIAAAGSGARLVLDVGHGGAEATRLADGRVLACRTSSVGGSALDEVLDEVLVGRLGRAGVDAPREAGRMREALSLMAAAGARSRDPAGELRVTGSEVRGALAGRLGEAVDALRAVQGRDGRVPVLLIGGVARAPLLAELVDEAGFPDVVVAPVPEAAAVLGALRPGTPIRGSPALPARSGTVGPRAAGRRRDPPRRGPAPDGPLPDGPLPDGPLPDGPLPDGRVPDRPRTPDHARGTVRPGPPVRSRLPPQPPRGRGPGRSALRTGASALGVAAVVALRPVAPPPSTGTSSDVLVQYGYRLDVPTGWEHTGGLPERRRSLLTPAPAPDGSDLIVVERTPLGYDATAEPERAAAELRAEFAAAVAAGSTLTGYSPATRVAERDVVSYHQLDPGGRIEVDWFVVLDRDAQLSVGCRHTAAGVAAVRAACAVVVGSVRRS